jgi:hypothetical protein
MAGFCTSGVKFAGFPTRELLSITSILLDAVYCLGQWYSTGGTRRHLRGYVKFKISIYILFHE